MTTEGSDEFKQRGRELGATGWITKPFDPEKLVKIIHRVTQTDKVQAPAA
jgi:two-component system chemotaxis response regulator CheY